MNFLLCNLRHFNIRPDFPEASLILHRPVGLLHIYMYPSKLISHHFFVYWRTSFLYLIFFEGFHVVHKQYLWIYNMTELSCWFTKQLKPCSSLANAIDNNKCPFYNQLLEQNTCRYLNFIKAHDMDRFNGTWKPVNDLEHLNHFFDIGLLMYVSKDCLLKR
jgi:hypothetical protein